MGVFFFFYFWRMCEGLLTDKVFVLVLCFKVAVGKDVLGRKRTRAAALRGLNTPYKAAGLGRQDLSRFHWLTACNSTES